LDAPTEGSKDIDYSEDEIELDMDQLDYSQDSQSEQSSTQIL